MISSIRNYIRNHPWIFLLFIIGFVIRWVMAAADPFLHPWDERFHALVARNMMEHPFQPMLLLNPVLPYDYTHWWSNYIWVHKQPLFMWQMAMSMKVFGISEFGFRLPSVLMGSLMILITYRIAWLFSNQHQRISILASVMMTFSCFQIRSIAGIQTTDHNDIAHQFYILCSLWAFAEYLRKPTIKWAFWIGCFAGAAILNKWLTGLLVFLGWTFLAGLFKEFRTKKSLLHYSWALLICALVFLPWQIYIHTVFPKEAAHELAYNTQHLSKALEGHSGPWYYYLNLFDLYFGYFLYWLILPGMLFTLKDKQLNTKLSWALTINFLFTFLFFSFIVQTKMESFFFFVAPIGFIYIAVAIDKIIHFERFKYLFPLTVIVVALMVVNIQFYRDYFSKENTERNKRIANARIYKDLSKYIDPDTRVVINMNSHDDKNVMFYNPSITAYHWWPSEAELQQLLSQKIKLAAFRDHDQYVLPDYVRNYPYLQIIEADIYSFE